MRLLYVGDARAAAPWDEAAGSAAASSAGRGGSGSSGGSGSGASPPAPPPEAVVVMLPATGEQGYRERVALARALVARAARPVAVIILMAPYYAARRPSGQRGHFNRTVAEYQAQSAAISMEAAALLAWAHVRAPRARLCATGFSWGAAMATGAALLASLALPRGVAARQLCVAAYVGSASPVALLTGLLATDIDFAALEAASPGARERLLALFRRSNFQAFVDEIRSSPALATAPLIGAAACVSMSNDAFVSAAEAAALRRTLEAAAPAGRTSARVFGGGHAGAAAARGSRQVAAIEGALAMLEDGGS